MLDDKNINLPLTRICPVCQTENPLDALQKRDYRCVECKLEMAHLDYAQDGRVRGVFGWLIAPKTSVQEHYKIHSVLCKGGFGAAYLVYDLHFNGKRSALKEVPSMLFDNQEIGLLGKLHHPAIPGIIDHWTAGGMSYQVLKFSGSRTLGGERLNHPNQRIPMEKLLPWIRQLCDVLAYLHGQHPPIIHHDLKPDNILINEDGGIMLIDVGIVKDSKSRGMIRILDRAASPGFSPPEQEYGSGIDERSDIYALGATFYALLTGQNPPSAHKRVAGEALPPPSQFVPGISRELEGAILKSLSLDMKLRQRSIREFATALEPQKIKSVLYLVGLAAILATLAVGGYFYFSITADLKNPDPPRDNAVDTAVHSGMDAVSHPDCTDATNPNHPWVGADSEPARTWRSICRNDNDILNSTTLPSGDGRVMAKEPGQATPAITPACADCPEMVRLDGGGFWMGSDDSDKEAAVSEKPFHRVLVRPFSLGKYEVTRGQYAAFVKGTGYSSGLSCWSYKNGSFGDQLGADWRRPGFAQDDNHPVVCVNLADALAYIAWLNRKTGQTFRLPTEAEWEYAVRGGTNTNRYWGDNADDACRYANVADQTLKAKPEFSRTVLHICTDGYAYTAPVGSFQSNGFQLNDMMGNVWEWTCSAFEEKFAGGEKECVQNDDATTRRTLRGGSWGSDPQYVRSAYRRGDGPTGRYNGAGFRLAED